MTSSLPLPRTLADITPAWLTGALRDGGCLSGANVVATDVQPVGQEFGFLDGLARLRLTTIQIVNPSALRRNHFTSEYSLTGGGVGRIRELLRGVYFILHGGGNVSDVA